MNKTELSKLTELKLQREAGEQGIELIGPGKNYNFRTYRLGCGHEQEIQTSNVRRGVFKCRTCLDEKLNAEAREQGIQLIGPGRDASYRTYRLECGHEQQIWTGAVRNSAFKCRTCGDSKAERKLNAEAAERGIELIGPGRTCDYRTYRLACGHEREIQTGAVRDGVFACHTCGNHSWTKPSYLYVIRVELDDGQSYIKLGVSNNTERRINQYGLPYYATATVLATALFPTREESDLAESMLFERYVEWKIPPTQVDDIFTKSGSTEVYDSSIEHDAVRLVLSIGQRMIKT